MLLPLKALRYFWRSFFYLFSTSSNILVLLLSRIITQVTTQVVWFFNINPLILIHTLHPSLFISFGINNLNAMDTYSATSGYVPYVRKHFVVHFILLLVFAGIATTAVILRLWARRITNQTLALSDYLTLLGLVRNWKVRKLEAVHWWWRTTDFRTRRDWCQCLWYFLTAEHRH